MLDFKTLWNNHPTISDGERFPCQRPSGVTNFSNQCAIRLGISLQKSDLLRGYDGATCWHGHRGQGHTLRARELAKWMKKNRSRFGHCKRSRKVQWQDYQGKHGIIFCENFWGQNNTGDHIDLWDGTGKFMRESDDFHWEGPALASGGLDYIERSERVWFWEIDV